MARTPVNHDCVRVWCTSVSVASASVSVASASVSICCASVSVPYVAMAVLGVAVMCWGSLPQPHASVHDSPKTIPPINGDLPHEERLWRLNRYIANMGTNRRHASACCGRRSRVRRSVEVVRLAGEVSEPSTRATTALPPGPTSHRCLKSRRRRTSIGGRITGRISQGGCLESRRLDVEDKWMDQKMSIGCGLRRNMPDQGVFNY